MTSTTITIREREILRLVANEYSSKEIAHRLNISDHTVQSHRQNLMVKFKVKNTAGLVRQGFERGILQLQDKY